MTINRNLLFRQSKVQSELLYNILSNPQTIIREFKITVKI